MIKEKFIIETGFPQPIKALTLLRHHIPVIGLQVKKINT